MTAFSLLGQSRDLVNRYFKTNFITLLILWVFMVISFAVSSYTQTIELSLIEQIQTNIFSGTSFDLSSNPTSLHSEQLQQIGVQFVEFISRPDVRNIIFALLWIQLWMLVLWSFAEIGSINMGLEIASNHEQKSWKAFFYNWNMLGSYWWTTFIQWCAIILWLICLIVPGIYIACRLSLSNYILLSKKCSISEALHSSRSLSKWHTRLIFKTAVLLWLAQLVWLIAMGIGLIWTYPMTWTTWWLLYDQLTQKKN
jgi:hypothetical protein